MKKLYSQGFLQRLGAIATVLAIFAVTSACGSDGEVDRSAGRSGVTEETEISVGDVWARPSLAGGNTAIYLSVKGGSADDQLVSVKSPDLANAIEIHETVPVSSDPVDSNHSEGVAEGDTPDHDDGMNPASGGQMRTMRPVEAIDVPAGGQVELAPGGFHVMVMNLHHDLSIGDSFSVTFTFTGAGDIAATARVKES